MMDHLRFTICDNCTKSSHVWQSAFTVAEDLIHCLQHIDASPEISQPANEFVAVGYAAFRAAAGWASAGSDTRSWIVP